MDKRLLLLIVFCWSCFFLAACQDKPAENDLFPLSANLTWHYDASFRAGRVSSHHKLIITNQKAELEGQKVTSRRFHNGDVAYYDKSEKGIFRLALNSDRHGLVKDQENHFLIRFPLEQETQWDLNSKPFFLEQSVRKINSGQASLSANLKIDPLIMHYQIMATDEKIRVKAGTFSRCVRVTGKGDTRASGPEIGTVKINVVQTDWYAPGTGLIKSERRETTNLDWAKSSVYSMELDRIY